MLTERRVKPLIIVPFQMVVVSSFVTSLALERAIVGAIPATHCLTMQHRALQSTAAQYQTVDAHIIANPPALVQRIAPATRDTI